MNASWILLISILFFYAGYRFYGGYVSRVFGLEQDRPTPAETQYDGTDYVPAKNWVILFGHHFSTIAGAGPVIGPVLACVYWGWGPALLWVLLGSVFIGGVHDFATLFMSVRSRGVSISEITKTEISPSARLFFSVFVWVSLILVIAVFALFAAQTFIAEPDVVVPAFGAIPIALVLGWLIYRRRVDFKIATLIGLLALAACLVLGVKFPVEFQTFGGLGALNVWILLLFLYCFIASVTPVQILLQPRDYLTSYLLLAAVGIGIAGVFVTRPGFSVEHAFSGFLSAGWPEAGFLWPMLFVTVACGAVSGFHSLVSSGTSSKQIASEKHLRRIGYGSMIAEGLLAVLVIICVSAGLAHTDTGALLRSGGPIVVFSHGFHSISESFFSGYGKAFAVMVLNAFILSTLDSATRIGRYLTSELFGIRNKYAATLIVVVLSGALAVSGQWQKIWPVFGASNQLVAGLALLVASCWLLQRRKPFWMTLAPAFFMLVTTIGALGFQFWQAVTRKISGAANPDGIVAGLSLVLALIAVYITLESARIFRAGLATK